MKKLELRSIEIKFEFYLRILGSQMVRVTCDNMLWKDFHRNPKITEIYKVKKQRNKKTQ